MPSRKTLIHRPGPRLADGLVTHVERTPVDPALALSQWEAYVAALRAHGCKVLHVNYPGMNSRACCSIHHWL
jgi:dimethylargininase